MSRETFETLIVCRRCEEFEDEDYAVLGLCRRCMEEAGLVECGNCGRAFAKEIATLCKDKTFCCPVCVKDLKRQGVEL